MDFIKKIIDTLKIKTDSDKRESITDEEIHRLSREIAEEIVKEHLEIKVSQECPKDYNIDEEHDNFMRDSKIYPVCINGNWFNVEDIDKAIREPERETNKRLIEKQQERYKQSFYNQTIHAYIYNLQQYSHDHGFNGIKKHSYDLTKAAGNILKLYERDDYVKRIQRAFEYSCFDTKDEANKVITELVLNPTLFESYFVEQTKSGFYKDVKDWDETLSQYKQKKAYINRLNYLIGQMEMVEAIGLPFMQDIAAKQKEIYRMRLSE